MAPAMLTSVRVDRNQHGGWEIVLPDQTDHVICATLEDAKRIAHLCAAQRHPCELIVRDAYHRVLDHEYIDGE
jgi:hypothetical protein